MFSKSTKKLLTNGTTRTTMFTKGTENMKRGDNVKIDKQKYELAKARACMGQKDLIAAGISKCTLSRAINGGHLRPETIGRIAKALSVDVTEIIETE